MTDDDLEALLAQHDCANAPRFSPAFDDRVMARIATAANDAPALMFERALTRQTRRMLPALAAASMAIAAWNWWSVRESAPSTFSAILGVAGTVQSDDHGLVTATGLANTEAFQ